MFSLAAIKSAPVVILIGVASISAAGWYGYQKGGEHARNASDAQMAATMQAVANRAIEQAAKDAETALKLEAEQREIEAIFTRMQREVSEYVRTHPTIDECGLDDDGLRIWTAANNGRASAEDSASESSDAVPPVAGPGVGEIIGPSE